MKTIGVPVIRRDAYTLSLEQYENLTFVHMNVYKWTKTVREEFTSSLDKLMELHRGPLFAIHEPVNNKQRKFFMMFGFEYYQDVLGMDGETRHLYIRTRRSLSDGH